MANILNSIRRQRHRLSALLPSLMSRSDIATIVTLTVAYREAGREMARLNTLVDKDLLELVGAYRAQLLETGQQQKSSELRILGREINVKRLVLVDILLGDIPMGEGFLSSIPLTKAELSAQRRIMTDVPPAVRNFREAAVNMTSFILSNEIPGSDFHTRAQKLLAELDA